MKAIVGLEKHLTHIGHQVSVMQKLVAVRMVITAILSLVLTRNRTFLQQEVAQEVMSIWSGDLASSVILRIVALPVQLHRRLLWRTALTQARLNPMIEGEPWSLGERSTDMMNTLFVALFCSAIAPSGCFITRVCFLRRQVPPAAPMGSGARDSMCAHMWVTLWFHRRWPFVDEEPATFDERLERLECRSERGSIITACFALAVITSACTACAFIGEQSHLSQP
jgi:hypothetical protein